MNDKVEGTPSACGSPDTMEEARAVAARIHLDMMLPASGVKLAVYDISNALHAAEVRRDALWREAIGQLGEWCDTDCWNDSPTAVCDAAAPLRALLASNASEPKAPPAIPSVVETP